LVKFAYGGLVFGLAASENDTFFKSGQSRIKSKHLPF